MNSKSPTLKKGTRHCQCRACGKYFNSLAGFDKHRTGAYGVDRRCMTTDEMTSSGMATNAGGYWVTALFEGDTPWV